MRWLTGLWLLLVPALLAQNEEIHIPPGKIAVIVECQSDGPGIFRLSSQAGTALKNHLDFYLWRRGWEYQIFDRDSLPKGFLSKRSKAKGEFAYYLELKAGIKFQPLKERNRRASEGKYFINYPVIDRLEMALKLEDNGGRRLLRTKNNFARDDTGWLRPDSMAVMFVTPEPPDITIKKALEAILGFLPQNTRPVRPSPAADSVLALFLIIDSAFQDSPETLTMLEEAVAYASHLFYDQFGRTIEIEGRMFAGLPGDSLGALAENLATVQRQVQPAATRLITTFYIPRDGYLFYQGGRSYHIGLSDVLSRHAMLAWVPSPNPDLPNWEAYTNGQLLLHEIGHLLGGVHVSDIYSLMLPHSPWVTSGRFDVLNRFIIEKGLGESGHLKRVTAYLTFIMEALEKTGYQLADYPELFYSFARLNADLRWRADTGDSGVARSVPLSLEGLLFYRQGNRERARELFQKALETAPNQGVLHFYLSQLMEGPVEERHLKISARMGYFEAMSRLMSRE